MLEFNAYGKYMVFLKLSRLLSQEKVSVLGTHLFLFPQGMEC